jgi:transcriptional regulator with XRE-family HTH domain
MMHRMDSPEQLTPERVKELRTARGWTQEELAAIAGLSSHAIVSNVERGLRPGAEVERRLREVLIPRTSGALIETPTTAAPPLGAETGALA